MDYIQSAREELKQLRQLYVAQINLDKDRMLLEEYETANVKQQVKRMHLNHTDKKLGLQIARIVNALCVLSGEEKQILLMCYAAPDFTPEDAMDILHMEKSTFYRKKKTALEKFARALYGCEIK